MSQILTFRQKTIRILCSAAACGLSVSFLVGEAVDFEASRLRTWVEDPALFPKAYLPLNPVRLAMERWELSPWREEMVASNSLSIPAIPESPWEIGNPRFLAQQNAAPRPSEYGDHLVLVQAASAKVANMAIQGAEEKLNATDVERVLVSIEAATAKLSNPALGVVSMPHAEAPLSPRKEKTALQPSVVPLPTIATIEAPKKPALSAAISLASANRAMGDWQIQGRVAPASAPPESGHFEIGLYSKIDPEGLPVGYPLVQQILPAGQTAFRLSVPSRIVHGYLYGEFVAQKNWSRRWLAPLSNPWSRDSHQIADLYLRADDSIIANAAAPEQNRDLWHIRGTVSTMFAAPNAPIPQEDVVVKVRGRKEAARTDKHGNFSLELPRLKGQLFLELIKSGYQPSVVGISANDSRPLAIEIASRHAIEQISQHLGSNQASLKGVFIGRAMNADGGGLRGLSLQTSLKADGPFYFDDEGVLDRDAKATSGDGRFLFLNLESGIGYVESTLNGEAIAPFQLSTVEGGELVQKTLTPTSGNLRGRLFNPVASTTLSPIGGAKVRVDGTADWVATDSFGAFFLGPLKWMRGEKIPLEVSSEHFNNHRYLIDADKQAGATLNLFAFPTAYLAKLAQSMDVEVETYSGLVIGKISGPGLRVDALADHSPVNGAKDFYFDGKGRLRGSHEMTDPRFGTFLIFNVPKGRTILEGNDANGALRFSDAIFASPSSVNVIME